MYFVYILAATVYLYGSVVEATECPVFLVAHKTNTDESICCRPAFNCPYDTEYVPCAVNGGNDTCKKCPTGTKNSHMTSYNNWMKYRCFNLTQRHERECSLGDHVPVDEDMVIPNNANCAFPCICDVTKCYFGNACSCLQSETSCGVNEQLNSSSGVCEACPEGHYKLEKGCGPCLWNETQWRIVHNASAEEEVMATDTVVKKTTDKEKTVTDGPGNKVITDSVKDNKTFTSGSTDKEDGELSMSVVVVVIVILVGIGIIVALLLVVRARIQRGDGNSRLVACYNTFACKLKGKDTILKEDPESAAASETNGTDKPSQAVKPIMQGPSSNGQEEDTPLFRDMSLGVHGSTIIEETNQKMLPTAADTDVVAV